MSTVMLPTPPAFDPTKWGCNPNDKGPVWYHGTKFDFDVVTSLLTFDEDGQIVTIMGRAARALNLQVETPAEDPNYPIYFELGGYAYHYVVSIWSDRTVIEVRHETEVVTSAGKRTEYPLLSVMFPETEEQLRRALQSIVQDLY